MGGTFDKKTAEELLKQQDVLSDKTGNPCMVDLVGASPQAVVKQLEFVASVTDASILIDSPAPNVRLAGLRYAKETGLINRIVYNSIIPETKTDELQEIRESGLESSILLTYNIREFTSEGRVKTANALIAKAQEAGISKPLIDTCVIDVPTLGMACKAFFKIKNEMGFPVGAGTHNAIGTWKGLKNKFGKEAVTPSSVSAGIIAIALGADFILYGPIEDAKYFFPSAAMVDAAYGQLLFEKGKRPGANHPLFRIG
jgi:tetrahydromethanopterin S-methyltransferase subunit H